MSTSLSPTLSAPTSSLPWPPQQHADLWLRLRHQCRRLEPWLFAVLLPLAVMAVPLWLRA